MALPAQQPGQRQVPAAAREAVNDRDGWRCVVPHCHNDGYTQHNHGRLRSQGGTAHWRFDQRPCGPDNRGHAFGVLDLVNRPDGGVWCLDGAGRWHDAVAPVAQQLDRALVRWLVQSAAREWAARSRAPEPEPAAAAAAPARSQAAAGAPARSRAGPARAPGPPSAA